MFCSTIKSTYYPNWINVKDKLPKNGQNTLCFPHYIIAMFGVDDEGEGIAAEFSVWDKEWERDLKIEVTHWVPLPEPPKID